MITLSNDRLSFRFPEIHESAKLDISFLRTLRIPDDGDTYYLPPGLGDFPLQHVDDHLKTVPPSWLKHGGVMLPMYQSEAMWLSFDSIQIEERYASYPFAIKIAAGKIDAVSGKAWTESLDFEDQNYVVSPNQPWLDGFCVRKGIIRQFVAMPLGEGFSVEEQLTDDDEFVGGLQIQAFPMKRVAFDRRFPKDDSFVERRNLDLDSMVCSFPLHSSPDMGLGAGGKMKQDIEKDTFNPEDWDLTTSSRCFVHLANSHTWQAITGSKPPNEPPTAKRYADYGLPWFDYYSDGPAVEGSDALSGIKSVNDIAATKGLTLLNNDPLEVDRVIKLRSPLSKNEVREGSF